MIDVNITATGTEKVLRYFDTELPDKLSAALAFAVREEARYILRESKQYVPTEDRDLIDSGRVEKGYVNEKGFAEYNVVYGGVKAYYSWIVHESAAMEEHRQRSGGDGQWKYLETPALIAARDGMVRISEALSHALEFRPGSIDATHEMDASEE